MSTVYYMYNSSSEFSYVLVWFYSWIWQYLSLYCCYQISGNDLCDSFEQGNIRFTSFWSNRWFVIVLIKNELLATERLPNASLSTQTMLFYVNETGGDISKRNTTTAIIGTGIDYPSAAHDSIFSVVRVTLYKIFAH